MSDDPKKWGIPTWTGLVLVVLSLVFILIFKNHITGTEKACLLLGGIILLVFGEKSYDFKAVGSWFGNIVNLVTLFLLFAITIIIYKKFSTLTAGSVLVLCVAGLVVLILIRYADVSRFSATIGTLGDIPPLGLAKGSVRAILAFSFAASFLIYGAVVATDIVKLDEEIFTALNSILAAVIGFYFGSRKDAPENPQSASSPKIDAIEPGIGVMGKPVSIKNISGTGFKQEATVMLAKGEEKILASDVKVEKSTQIACLLDLTNTTTEGKWNVVVTNPDGQKDTLVEGFGIKRV